MHDPAWGGEKRRLWDSAVVLMGLVHALFESRQADDGFTFVPKARARTSTDAPAPPFDAEKLLRRSGPALILHSNSPEHAARVARDLARQRGESFAVADFSGQPPAKASAIIISPAQPPAGWRAISRGYWVRDWSGPPQLWVRNKGHVYADTDPLVADLLLYLSPQRAEPLPFPDANFALAARLGELNGGEAALSAVSRFRRASGRLDLAGGSETLKVGQAEVNVRAEPDRGRGALKLSVGAGGQRPDSVELSVTLPAGWWLLNARDMSGRWDRVRDPVGEVRLPDGRIRLVYSFAEGEEPVHLTFELTRLEVPGS